MAGRGAPHSHPDQGICPAGRMLYARALVAEALDRRTADEAPCLEETGLLTPDAGNPAVLRPLPPVSAVSRLVLLAGRQYAEQLAGLSTRVREFDKEPSGATPEFPIARVSGLDRINDRLDAALLQCEHELLTVQPTAARMHPSVLTTAAARDTALLKRGVGMRTLYVHAVRFVPAIMDYQERIKGYQVEVRTLPGVIERMVVVDDTAAFIPANDDRSDALEIRYQPMVRLLRQCFESLWGYGTPLWEPVEYGATGQVVSPIQRIIARMMVEGHGDQEIAARLGINVRTVRGHIARLAALLGAVGRTQLGYLIARSDMFS